MILNRIAATLTALLVTFGTTASAATVEMLRENIFDVAANTIYTAEWSDGPNASSWFGFSNPQALAYYFELDIDLHHEGDELDTAVLELVMPIGPPVVWDVRQPDEGALFQIAAVVLPGESVRLNFATTGLPVSGFNIYGINMTGEFLPGHLPPAPSPVPLPPTLSMSLFGLAGLVGLGLFGFRRS